MSISRGSELSGRGAWGARMAPDSRCTTCSNVLDICVAISTKYSNPFSLRKIGCQPVWEGPNIIARGELNNSCLVRGFVTASAVRPCNLSARLLAVEYCAIQLHWLLPLHLFNMNETGMPPAARSFFVFTRPSCPLMALNVSAGMVRFRQLSGAFLKTYARREPFSG